MIKILVTSAKLAKTLKDKLFWFNGYDVIISVHDINKISPSDSNYIVVMWPKFGGSSIPIIWFPLRMKQLLQLTTATIRTICIFHLETYWYSHCNRCIIIAQYYWNQYGRQRVWYLKLMSAIFYQIFIFSANNSPLKTMRNVFYFSSKALEIFKFLWFFPFLFTLFRFKGTIVSRKIYDVMNWLA